MSHCTMHSPARCVSATPYAPRLIGPEMGDHFLTNMRGVHFNTVLCRRLL